MDSRNPQTHNNLPLFPLQPDHDDPAITEYESILPQLQQFRKPRADFLKGSTLLRYVSGADKNQSTPTICLLAHPGSLRELSTDEMDKLRNLTSLPVEVFESRTRRCVNMGQTATPQLDIVGVGMNSSSHRNGSGTIGGFLRDPKSGKLYGLTNHHVATEASAPITEDARRPQGRNPIHAFSPSERSLGMRLTKIRKDIEDTKKSIQLHRERAINEEDHETIEFLEQELTQLRASEHEAGSELGRDCERIFGRIVASSGVSYEDYKKEDGRAYVRTRDWALVEIDISQEMQEKHHPNLTNEWSWMEDGRHKTLKLKRKEFLGLPAKDTGVMKRGARTGITFGKIHGTYIELRIEGNLLDTTEEAICPANEGDFSFSDGGDSGALVVDRRGMVVGQVFGGEQIMRGGRNYVLSYYQPIGSILDAIREATGIEDLRFV